MPGSVTEFDLAVFGIQVNGFETQVGALDPDFLAVDECAPGWVVGVAVDQPACPGIFEVNYCIEAVCGKLCDLNVGLDGFVVEAGFLPGVGSAQD